MTPQSHQTHHAPQQQFSWDKPGKANLVEQQLPWMTVQVRSLIASYLKKESTVMLEYGGGGSTLFFGPRVKQLYTVESVKQFVERINGELRSRRRRGSTTCRPLMPLLTATTKTAER